MRRDRVGRGGAERWRCGASTNRQWRGSFLAAPCMSGTVDIRFSTVFDKEKCDLVVTDCCGTLYVLKVSNGHAFLNKVPNQSAKAYIN